MRLFFTFVLLTMACRVSLAQTPKKSELLTLNGHQVYYEVYGDGPPLFLLHGYTLSLKHWLPFFKDYAEDFEVYLVDLQGHGKSGPYGKDWSVRSATQDLEVLIKHLKLLAIDAIGFSYGGDVLFDLNVLHPGIIKSMVSIGACGTFQAQSFPELIDLFSYKNVHNLTWMPPHQTSEDQTRNMLDFFSNYDVVLTDEEAKQIPANVLIVLGDKDDTVPLGCGSRLKKYLPHSHLWILPNTGHNAHQGKYRDEFVAKSKLFLTKGLD